jgi:hypothetical protein
MAAMELLSYLLGIKGSTLLREETILFEANVFLSICNELKEIFRHELKNYFQLMQYSLERENKMLEDMFVHLVIKDILATNDYSIAGIANYIDVPVEVIQDVVEGRNTNPSAKLLRRTIALHKSVRGDLYRRIVKKIALEFSHFVEKAV